MVIGKLVRREGVEPSPRESQSLVHAGYTTAPDKVEPPPGFEPGTLRLQGGRSTIKATTAKWSQ